MGIYKKKFKKEKRKHAFDQEKCRIQEKRNQAFEQKKKDNTALTKKKESNQDLDQENKQVLLFSFINSHLRELVLPEVKLSKSGQQKIWALFLFMKWSALKMILNCNIPQESS